MLKGSHINLRALEEEDLKLLRDWRNTEHVRKTTREFKLLNMINQKNWFLSISSENPPRNIMFGVTNKNNKLIGVTGLTYIDWKNRHAEISIYLSNNKWQKTVRGKETIQLVLEYGFAELNLHRIWAEIFQLAEENIELFEQMGFVKEGILRNKLWRKRKWWNSTMYSILSSEYGHEKKD